MDLVSDPKAPVAEGQYYGVPVISPLTDGTLRGIVRGPRPWRLGWLPPMAGAEGDGDDDPDDKKTPPPDDKEKQQTFSREYVEALRTESAGYRTKFKDLEKTLSEVQAELKGRTDKEKTDAEKTAEALKEAELKAQKAEERLRRTALQAEVERQARKLGIVDEDAAFRLLDHDKLEYDDDGRPTNAATLLEDLAKAKPYLVDKTNGQNGKKGVPGSPPHNGSGSDLTKEELAAKTREEQKATGRYSAI